MQASIRPADGVPQILGYSVASGETFYKGAPVTLDGSGNLEEVDTDDVTGILGIATMGATVAGTPDWGDEVPVEIADDPTIFQSQVHSSAAILTSLANVVVGARYGIVKLSNYWYIDYDDTSNVVAEIMSKDEDNNIVFFKFIGTARVDG